MAKQKLFKKTTDPDTEAALAVVEMERKRDELKRTEQEQREAMIGQCYKAIGQVQTSNMFAKFATVSSLVWLQQVKGSKVYKDIPGVGTWDKFCDSVGMSRQKVDEDLANLAAFGEEFLTTCQQLSVGYRELRKLRKLTHDGDVVIDAEYVTIGEEKIPLGKESADELQAAIESLLEAKNQHIEEQTATLRAKDKVLKDKEKLINKQARELAKLEGRAEKMGLTAEEDAILSDLDNSRTIIDGFLMKYDPEKNPLPEDATPRMRAKLMHTLDYFRRVILAAYDTAADLYGEPELDDDWVPPHLRRKSVDDDQANDPPKGFGDNGCSSCNFRKGMMNPAKGVKIPGQSGKCTKDGGLCELYPQEA